MTWWRAAQDNGISSEFVNIAIQLLDAPCSSAAIERVFSNFSFIHTKIKNRLGNEKASKMVFCYRLLRGSKELGYQILYLFMYINISAYSILNINVFYQYI